MQTHDKGMTKNHSDIGRVFGRDNKIKSKEKKKIKSKEKVKKERKGGRDERNIVRIEK